MTKHKNMTCENCGAKHFERALMCPSCKTRNRSRPVEILSPKDILVGLSATTGIVVGVGWVFAVLLSLLFGGEDEKTSESVADKARQERGQAERRATGFHCLSGFNGAHRDVVQLVRGQLKEPSSFDHVETRITRVGNSGTHQLHMDYRAKNGFGGMVTATATAVIGNSNCQANILTLE